MFDLLEHLTYRHIFHSQAVLLSLPYPNVFESTHVHSQLTFCNSSIEIVTGHTTSKYVMCIYEWCHIIIPDALLPYV